MMQNQMFVCCLAKECVLLYVKVGASGGIACLKVFKSTIEPILHLFKDHKHKDIFQQVAFHMLGRVFHAVQTSAHKQDWEDPGIKDWLQASHPYLQGDVYILNQTSVVHLVLKSLYPHMLFIFVP